MTSFLDLPHRPSAFSEIMHGARVNLRVIVGLIFREASTRFGASPASYIWTLVEPAIFVALLLIARVYLRNSNPAFGDSSVLFLLTGLATFRATRSVINTGGRAIGSNRGLFAFGLVKPVDTVIARTVLEFALWVVILTVFFIAVDRVTHERVITDFEGFVLTMLLILYFCLAMAMFNATLGALFPLWRTIWKMMGIFLMLTSGVLYVPSQMPPGFLSVIVWNPFLHCVEGLRSKSYLDYITVYSPLYLLSFTTGVLLFSLALERLYRKEIIGADIGEDDIADFG